MDDIKLRLNESVAAKLNAAPASADKDELIEELSDNLYRRFLDMTGAGVPEEDAFNRALDDLGDVDELLAYLGVEAGEPDVIISDGGSQTRVKTENGQTRITTQDGQTITINNPGSDPITININESDETAADRMAAEAERIEAEAERVKAEAEAAGGSEARTDESGDVHYDYSYGRSGQTAQNDLDAIFANVSEICNIAVEQAREAIKQAKEAIQRRTTVERNNGHMTVHFNAGPDAPVPPEPPEPSEPTEPTEPSEPPEPPKSEGWEFEAELDSDQGRFFAGAGPKQRKDVVYGFGYDKAKGGFFAQWGEYQGGSQDREGRGPYFYGAGATMSGNDDGSYSVTALKDLRGIEVHTVSGDVTIHVSEAPDAGVIIDGDVDDLDVTCSADGVLTIREGRTASSSFFSRRGIGSADVELYLPRRHWEMISVNTVSGDIDIDRDGLDIDHLTVNTASGDTTARLRDCKVLSFKSASGDLDLSGACTDLLVETASGDVTLQGQMEDVQAKTASGDIQLEGITARFLAHTMSGDVEVETSVLPQVMELSSKSGDCRARIPDAGPFSLHMKTVTGEMNCEFQMNYINGTFLYGDGAGPCYTMHSVSGDVSLERY